MAALSAGTLGAGQLPGPQPINRSLHSENVAGPLNNRGARRAGEVVLFKFTGLI
jgi:hypothetical protein